jgi:hypothetical protein
LSRSKYVFFNVKGFVESIYIVTLFFSLNQTAACTGGMSPATAKTTVIVTAKTRNSQLTKKLCKLEILAPHSEILRSTMCGNWYVNRNPAQPLTFERCQCLLVARGLGSAFENRTSTVGPSDTTTASPIEHPYEPGLALKRCLVSWET